MNKHNYNTSFLQTLKKLNPQQRQAVDQIEGPVLVIAGPGTGKTHILTARIGQILLNTDTQAGNILCLTFTDAGVIAMRERLFQIIGPEAHKVPIYTFHSFCNSIIQNNIELFGKHHLEPLSELERIEIIRKIMDELPNESPLKQGKLNTYYYEHHLFELFKKMKTESWSALHIHNKVDEYIANLANDESYQYKRNSGKFKKGEIKQKLLEEAIAKMERLKIAASLYDRYLDYLKQYERYDYDDMILWVIEAFEQHHFLLQQYQERFLYFLVDEYQDTNGAQNQILELLISYWDNPNIFIVGDDDQSIYEFQGARLKNLTDFHNTYKENLKLIILKENYRSTLSILEASKAVINQNKKRIVNHLNVEKKLVAANQARIDIQILPRITVYPNRLHEDIAIVNKIEKLQMVGIPLHEIAIIYAQHKQVNNIIRLLENKQIPYQTKRKNNILDQSLIQNVRLLLEYLKLEYIKPFSGEHLLFQILHIDFFEIEAQSIAQLSHYKQQSDEHHFRGILCNFINLQKAVETPEKLYQLGEFIEKIIPEQQNLSLSRFLEQLINQSGLLQYVLRQTEKAELLDTLYTLNSFVQTETNKNPRLKLANFLEMLQQMDDNRISIPLQKNTHIGEGIRLVTAHSSKGLEFQYVFIIDAVAEFWESKKGNHRQFNFPDTITYSGEEDAIEARRRLFYVALTRAKESLNISYSEKNDKEKNLQRSIYVDELLSYTSLNPESKKVDPLEIMENQFMLLQSNAIPKVSPYETTKVEGILTNFKLSISAMESFLGCPLSFYYEFILQAPVLMSEQAAYGKAMHHALMLLFDQMQRSKEKVFPEVSAFLSFFEQKMYKLQAYFTEKTFSKKLSYGKSVLEKYYTQHLNVWHKQVKTEFSIWNTTIADIPVRGTIDKLAFYKDQTTIIDYKTGNYKPAKIRAFTEKYPEGGKYRRQLLFYKLLYENYLKSSQAVTTGKIAYLEPDNKGFFTTKKIDLAAEEAADLTKIIKNVYTKIMAREFYDGCGKKECIWCNLLQRNTPRPTHLANLEIEMLDDN